MDRHVYDNMAKVDSDHWWFVARRRIIRDLIEKVVKPKPAAKILEVGCGTGSNIELLRGFGSVDAVEPDEPARNLASERTGIAVKGGLLPGGVPLEDGHYDLIALFDVLEHIPDDEGALAELSHKLAPGGKLLLTVPAMPWLWSAHDVAHHHQRRYTRSALEKVLKGSGFRPVHVSHFNTLLFPLIVAARAVGKLTGREGGDDSLPPAPLNALLRGVFAAERYAVPHLSIPFGVSLAVIAERAAEAETLRAAA